LTKKSKLHIISLLKNFRHFERVLLIPTMYLVVSVCLDIVLQVSIYDRGLLPQHYFMSFVFIMLFALLLSYIRHRITQLCLASGILIFKSLIVISNYVGYSKIHELFLFQTLRATGEIFKAHDGSPLGIIVQVSTILLMLGLFITAGVYTCIKHYGTKSGHTLKNSIVILMVTTVLLGSQSAYCANLGKYSDNIVDNMLENTKYNYDSFQNKFYYLTTFGSTMFYVRNFLDVSKINAAKFPEMPNADNYPFIPNEGAGYYDKYKYQLNPTAERPEKTNLIMLMMETFEADALKPSLTPTLTAFQNKCTVINGYKGFERTCMTEYASLVGSHLLTEMWRDYGDVEVPQALPAIFRREGYESINAFHAFEKEFYGRDQLFTKQFGFDNIYDPTDFGIKLETNKGKIGHNSDTEMFDKMQEKMAPDDKSFFSYVLNVSTHYPHFGPRSVCTPTNETDKYGYPIYESIFPESLKEIYEEYNDGNLTDDDNFPKLRTATKEEHRAMFAFMTGMREFDNGVKILLHRLETTPDKVNGGMLIDHTAIVAYSDHFNYGAYDESENSACGLLSDNYVKHPISEPLAFMFYNPREYVARQTEAKNTPNVIRRDFMSNIDIYKTVCHLFNIETSTKYTLGVSALNDESFSIGVGFNSGIYFGYCPENQVYFTTRDFKRFETSEQILPSAKTIADCRARLETIFHSMQYMDRHYKRNTFKYLDDTKYFMLK